MMASDATSILDVNFRTPQNHSKLLASSPQWSGVIPLEQLHMWQLQALRDINSIASLPTDWNSYGSRQITSDATGKAIGLIVGLTGYSEMPRPHVAPVSGGGIQLLWRNGEQELDIEVLPNGSTEYLISLGEDCIDDGQLNGDLLPLYPWFDWFCRS
jgi:hypothetical protein